MKVGLKKNLDPDGETRTFAQMELEEKKVISHRGNAIRALKKALGK